MGSLWTIQRAISIEMLGLGRGSLRLDREPSMHAYILTIQAEGKQQDLLTALTRLRIEIEQTERHVRHELEHGATK